jgi:hypothetical protein
MQNTPRKLKDCDAIKIGHEHGDGLSDIQERSTNVRLPKDGQVLILPDARRREP